MSARGPSIERRYLPATRGISGRAEPLHSASRGPNGAGPRRRWPGPGRRQGSRTHRRRSADRGHCRTRCGWTPHQAAAAVPPDPHLDVLAGHLHRLGRHPRHRQQPPPVHGPGSEGQRRPRRVPDRPRRHVHRHPGPADGRDDQRLHDHALGPAQAVHLHRRALDVLFLWGVATSNALPAIAAFVSLLQFSSNFAQGPFQGYVPDLVPAKQVGLASGLWACSPPSATSLATASPRSPSRWPARTATPSSTGRWRSAQWSS